jgi:phage terminase large subunit
MARAKNIPAADPQERVYELFDAWSLNPRKFVEEALLEPKGKRLTRQQAHALEELRKLVYSKMRLKKAVDTALVEKFPTGSIAPTPEQLKDLADACMSSLTATEQEYARKMGISISSGKGPGKDSYASWVMIWFLLFFRGSSIPSVAPSAHQLQDILWGEVSIWLSGSLVEHLFTVQKEKIYPTEGEAKEKWYAMPLTANPKADATTQAGTISGLHAEFMLVIFDEADAIPEPVYTALDSTLTKIVNIALLIFNPTRNRGFAIETQKSNRWIAIRWNAEESENVSRESIEYKREHYGEDSNYYRVFVLGLPPVAENGVLIPWDWILDAKGRELETTKDDPLILGVDVGGGGDLSVVCPRHGGVVGRLLTNNSPDTMTVTGWIARTMDLEAERLNMNHPSATPVDIIGLGKGVYDRLREMGKRNIYAVDVRRTARNPERFHRVRDENWWRVRRAFEEGTISIPNDPELVAGLSVIKYEEDSSGKIRIREKKSTKKELDSSGAGGEMDKCDALMHTYFMEDKTFKRAPVGSTTSSWDKYQAAPDRRAWMRT